MAVAQDVHILEQGVFDFKRSQPTLRSKIRTLAFFFVCFYFSLNVQCTMTLFHKSLKLFNVFLFDMNWYSQ